MLYCLRVQGSSEDTLEPVPFLDFSALGRREKQLEQLLAEHLLDVLFDTSPLMPVFRERSYQPEADLYALNEHGDLVIFELKLGLAGGEAVHQVMRYAQEAGQWSFDELSRRFSVYLNRDGDPDVSLSDAHREAFQLERELLPSEFNRTQHLRVIGNAADAELVRGVDYWRRTGISISFVPYRIYEIEGTHYFELFSLPYDSHINPAHRKGVLFDTNASWDEDAVWEMMEKRRVAAYGDQQTCVDRLNPRDTVFFSHKGFGLIAVGEVVGPTKTDGPDQRYHDVKFLTPVPRRKHGIQRYMPFSEIAAVTGKSFFWARTVKVPYLSSDEADTLLEAVRKTLA